MNVVHLKKIYDIWKVIWLKLDDLHTQRKCFRVVFNGNVAISNQEDDENTPPIVCLCNREIPIHHIQTGVVYRSFIPERLATTSIR